jgi:hypothetical protein
MGIFGSKGKRPSPPPVVLQLLGSVPIAKCIQVVCLGKIADLLEDGPKSIAELAASSGLKEDHLFRVMRALKSYGIFDQTGDGRWKNNAQSSVLIKDAPGSLHTMVHHIAHESFYAYSKMYEGCKAGETKTPWDLYAGEPIWKWYAAPENEFALHNFNTFMVANSKIDMAAVLNDYDWKKYSASTVADIGGGKGHLLKELMAKYPEMKGIVFDLPDVISDTKEFWEGSDDRVEIVAGDFFKGVPKSDVYVMKHILHDWSDEKCVEILTAMHPTMKSNDSKLVVIEAILPEDKPLEPWHSFLDIQMMSLVGGKERTPSDWKKLFGQAGFKLHNIVLTSGRVGIVEASAV